MKKMKHFLMRMSLNKKIRTLTVAIMIIMTVIIIATMSIEKPILEAFNQVLKENSECYELQEAMEKEAETFQAYMRKQTSDNKLNFEAACTRTQQCIGDIPFVYEEIGQERYARTWNIVNGYEGYSTFRDKVVKSGEANVDFVSDFYRVCEMQQNLLNYIRSLTQVVLEEGHDAYMQKSEVFGRIPNIILMSFIVVLIVLWGILKFLSGILVEPIVNLAKAAREIAENHFDIPDLPVRSEDEVGQLVKAFNKMKHATKNYIITLEEKNRLEKKLHQKAMEKQEIEKRLADARLDALKSQINPHFLFNTLNMISSMARIEDAPVTDQMSTCLGNLFRYNLRMEGQKVYLENELQSLQDYIYIQQMRFEGRVHYHVHVFVDESEVKIPAFILQPLAENALIHGISEREEGGDITIRIKDVGEDIKISVADNGEGMSRVRLEEIRQNMHTEHSTQSGIGLGNICKRMDILYGPGKVKIYSRRGRGTIVEVVVPQDESDF